MSLSPQEARCVSLACGHLSKLHGGAWDIPEGPTLDQLHPDRPSPETLITNGSLTAAVEVKRLTGDSVLQTYMESIQSLERSLAPSCGGYYTLEPPIDLRLPLHRSLRRQLKVEIERIAPKLGLQDSGAILIPRSGHISLITEAGPPHIHCLHGRMLFGPILDQVSGQFFLVDEGLQHSFFTDEGRRRFLNIVAERCRARLAGEYGPFQWHEEWQLTKVDAPEPGVFIVCVTEARDMGSSVAECVYRILEKALGKFTGERWSELHLLVLECSSATTPQGRVSSLISDLDPAELESVDMILIVDGDCVIQAHPRSVKAA
jgi:hypothetical protein